MFWRIELRKLWEFRELLVELQLNDTQAIEVYVFDKSKNFS